MYGKDTRKLFGDWALLTLCLRAAAEHVQQVLQAGQGRASCPGQGNRQVVRVCIYLLQPGPRVSEVAQANAVSSMPWIASSLK